MEWCIVVGMNTLSFFLLHLPIAYLALVSVPILFFDRTERRVPNKYTIPAFFLWLVCSSTYALISGEWLWSLVMPLVFGFLSIAIGVYFSGREWIGMGDVKLLVVMGLVMSYKFVWVWLVLPACSLALGIVCMWIYHNFIKRLGNTTGRLAPYVYFVYFVLIAFLFFI